jgi:hypothetical protein
MKPMHDCSYGQSKPYQILTIDDLCEISKLLIRRVLKVLLKPKVWSHDEEI